MAQKAMGFLYHRVVHALAVIKKRDISPVIMYNNKKLKVFPRPRKAAHGIG